MFIRPFAVMCWTYWKFYELCKAQKISNPTRKEIQAFSEKVEILLTWGHKLKNIGGVPGTDADPPTGGKRVPLTFKAWGRKPSSTSLMAPVQYGPALKTNTGLGFLEPLPAGFFRAAGNGLLLAQALESRLSQNAKFKLLNSLTQTAATEEDALELFDSWSVEKVTKAERAAFLRAFYDSNSEGSDSDLGRRSMAVGYVLAVLGAAGRPLKLSHLRRAMFYWHLSKKHPLKVPWAYRRARMLWVAMHVRRAQRLALESLFSWVEGQILAGRGKREGIVEAGVTEIQNSQSFLRPTKSLHASAAIFLKGVDTLDDLIAKGLSDPDYCVFSHVEALKEEFKNSFEAVVPKALTVLVLCSKFTDLLGADPHMSWLLNLGRAERLSMQYCKDFMDKHASERPREFLSYLLEHLVVSQHLSVATRRYDGGTQRLRISIEEEGLTSITGRSWEPPITSDKLTNAISLMGECGLVKFNRDDDQVSLPD
jgi:hypothetical protein